MACGSRTYVCPPPSPICTASFLQTVRCGMRQLTHTLTHTHTHSGACVCTSIFTSITTSYNIKVCSMAYKKEAKDLPTYTYIHSRRQQTVGMCSRGGGRGEWGYTRDVPASPASWARPSLPSNVFGQLSTNFTFASQAKAGQGGGEVGGEVRPRPRPALCPLFAISFGLSSFAFSPLPAPFVVPQTHTHSHRIG